MTGDLVVEADAWRHRIRVAREKSGLSRKEAARRAGLSEGVWRNVETGVQHIAGAGTRPYTTTPNTVARMAATVKLDPREVVAEAGMDPDAVHVESVSAELGPGDVRIIVVRGNRSTDEVLAEVRRLLDGLEQ